MHLFDAIEEYNFDHEKHFDTVTGQYDLLMPHDLGRPLTHEEMDYNFLYQKQTMNGFRIFGSGVNLRLNTDDTDKVLKFHQIDPLDDNYNDYTAAGYVTGQWIWIPEEVNVVVVSYISLVANPTTINETNNNTTTFTLTTLNATDGTTVNWSIATGGGITANDFIGGSLTGTATITNNTATWNVAAAADNFTELNETFTLTLASIDSQGNDTTTLNAGNPLSANVTIVNSSSTPAYVTLTGSSNSVAEGGSITYTVNTVNFFQAATATWGIDFTQSAANAADFTASSGTVNIDANGNGTFTITTVSDFIVEGNENFVVRLVGNDSNGVPTNIGVTSTITNVAFPTYTTFTGPASAQEGDTVTYTLSGTTITNGTTVGYTITGIDVTDISLANLTGNITMNSGQGTVSFDILEDYTVESPEDLVITLNGADSASNTTGLPMAVTTTITDVASTYSIFGSGQIVEGETKTYTFKATNMSPGTFVYWELRNYVAGNYVDWNADIISPRTGNGQVVQVGNEVQLNFDIEVSNDYTSGEGDEYLKIVVWDDAANYDTASPDFGSVVSGALATKDITVVDLAPQWQLTTVGDPVAGGEDDQAEPEVLTFNILTRYVPVGTPFTWEAKAYGANPAAAADFDGGNWPTGSGTVSTFNNTISLDSQFTTSVIADNTTENDPEEYILELSDANGVVASKIINITDNSQTPPPIVYDLQVSPLSIVEDTNAQYMEFTVTATQSNGNIPPAGTQIDYDIAGDWGANDIQVLGVDAGTGQNISEPEPVAITPQSNPYDLAYFILDSNGVGKIRVYGLYDQLVENGEDVTVTLAANDSAGNPTGAPSATGVINDSAAQVWQLSGPVETQEGMTNTFEVKTQNVPAQAYTYQIVASGSSPASANDFVGGVFPSGSGAVSANHTSLTTDGTHTTEVVVDALEETYETYTIELYDAGNNLVASKEITINDKQIFMGPAGNPQNENGGVGEWVSNDEGVTYHWQLFNTGYGGTEFANGVQLYWRAEPGTIGTAASGADFQGGSFPSGTVTTQSAGSITGYGFNTSQARAVWSVTIAADLSTEGDEYYSMKIYYDASYTQEVELFTTPDNLINVKINDTSTTPVPTFALTNDGPVNEGDFINWTLTTANVANGTVVPFALTGTASAPQDYSNVQPFEFTVQNNTATYTVVTFVDNLTDINNPETIILTLAANDSAGNATGSIASTANINDTSQTPTYSTITAQTVNEGQNMIFTLSTANVANGTTVNFAFSGTATQGTDYTVPGALQMTINNNSATYTIATTADQITDGNETVIMTLNATDSNGFGTGSITGTGNINDTSQAPVFDCGDAGLSIPNGTVGDTVTGTVTNGAIASINPATYQSGVTTYTAQITVPATDGNGVAYGNAGQNEPCTDTADGTAPAEPMYWMHLGETPFPYNKYLMGSGPFYYEATNGTTSETDFAPIFEDMINNPGDWTVSPGSWGSQQTLSSGDTFNFPAGTGSNYYYFLIPDSFGTPDLTVVAKLSAGGGPNDIAAAKKTGMTINGIAYTMYRVSGQDSQLPLSVQYN